MVIRPGHLFFSVLAIALVLSASVPGRGTQARLLAAAPTNSAPLFVDDDGRQCAQAKYKSINAAIAAAKPGDKIKVCAGLYNENVVVNKNALSLQGSTTESAAERCLRDDDAANPDRDSIINGEVRLVANDVLLDSLTIQGAPVTPGAALPAGIETSALFSGYVIRHNVVQNNPAGINLESNGATLTLVDHNCIRRNNVGQESENELPVGIFAEQGVLSNARIEANTFTGHDFGSMFLGYGLVDFPIITAPDTNLTVTNNLSVDDGVAGIIVSNVSQVEISHNQFTRTGNAVAVYPPASDVLVDHNEVENSPFTGIRVDGSPFGCCIFKSGPTNITVAHNHVTGAGTAFAQDGISLNRTSGDLVLDNLVEGSSREGVGVRNSANNMVIGNHAEENGRDGIRSRGTSSGNAFDANHMSGNAEHDAHDENRPANTWTGNHCLTDFPTGTICGQ